MKQKIYGKKFPSKNKKNKNRIAWEQIHKNKKELKIKASRIAKANLRRQNMQVKADSTQNGRHTIVQNHNVLVGTQLFKCIEKCAYKTCNICSDS